MSYVKGLQEVGDGLYAYLQPDGSWGWSNAGLVVDGERTLLIDTLYDLALTEQMLQAMRRAVPAAAASTRSSTPTPTATTATATSSSTAPGSSPPSEPRPRWPSCRRRRWRR